MTARRIPDRTGSLPTSRSRPSGATPEPAAPGPRHPSPSRLPALLPIVVAVAVAVAGNILGNGFVNDDEHQVLLNPWLKEWQSIPEIFTHSVWSFLGEPRTSDYYRPGMHLAYLCVARVAGLKAWAFHLLSLLLHVGNTALVFLLSREIAGLRPTRETRATVRNDNVLATVAALLFAVHPIHVEAVAWIASVPELAFSFFSLAAILLHVRADLVGSPRRWPIWVAFALALLFKETAVVVPAILFAYDLALGSSRGAHRLRARDWLPGVAILVGYLLVRHEVLARAPLVRREYWTLTPVQLIASALELFREYLASLLLPVSLSFWHPFRPVRDLVSFRFLGAVLAAAGFAAGVAWSWRRDRRLFFGLALVAIPLAPAFYIAALPAKPFAERYLYLPSVGFVLVVALLLSSFATTRRSSVVAAIAVLVVTVAGAVATVDRNSDWKDAYELYRATAKTTSDAPVPPLSLAMKLLRSGHSAEAIAQLRILALVHPEDGGIRGALGAARLEAGDLDGAIEDLRAAVALAPDSSDNLNDLAIAYRRAGRTGDAITLYRQVLERQADHPEAHFNLAGLLAESGDGAGALEHYRRAVELRPQNAYYQSVLGIELARAGNIGEAIPHFEEAARLAPDEPAYRNNLERARKLAQR